jgi:hypothetical protein
MRSSWSAPPTRSALLQRHPGQHRARADRQRRRGRRVAPRVSTGLRLSVLDQTPVSEGSTAAQALRNSIDLAQLADRLGYHRYWVAEHQGDGLVAGPSPAAAASGRAGARAWSCRDLQRRVPVRAIRDAGVRPGVGEQRPDDAPEDGIATHVSFHCLLLRPRCPVEHRCYHRRPGRESSVGLRLDLGCCVASLSQNRRAVGGRTDGKSGLFSPGPGWTNVARRGPGAPPAARQAAQSTPRRGI